MFERIFKGDVRKQETIEKVKSLKQGFTLNRQNYNGGDEYVNNEGKRILIRYTGYDEQIEVLELV